MTTPELGTSDRSWSTCAAACCVTLLAVALAAPAVAQTSTTRYQSGNTTTFDPPARFTTEDSSEDKSSAGLTHGPQAQGSVQPIRPVTEQQAQASVTRYQSGTTTTFSAPAQPDAELSAAGQSITSTSTYDPKGQYRMLPVKEVMPDRAPSATTTLGPPAASPKGQSPTSADGRRAQDGTSPVKATDPRVFTYQSGTTTTFGPPAPTGDGS
jgi:hypothetical protein